MSFCKGDRSIPAFTSLLRGLNLALSIHTDPMISSAPLSRSPLAATPAPLLRGCSREAFLTINHAAEIRFPPDKSPAQSGRKGGESICLIAVDPSFCTPQPLAKWSSGGVSARSARLLPAGVTMEWQNAIPGLAERLPEPGCRQRFHRHGLGRSTPLCPGRFPDYGWSRGAAVLCFPPVCPSTVTTTITGWGSFPIFFFFKYCLAVSEETPFFMDHCLV